MGIKFSGPFRQGAAALPVAGISRQESLIRGRVSIHRVESDGSIRRISERLKLPPVIQHCRQGVKREVIGWRRLGRTPRRGKRPREWIRLGVESVNILFHVKYGEHRPAIGVRRRLLDGPLQVVARRGVLFAGDPLEITKAMQQGLVWS